MYTGIKGSVVFMSGKYVSGSALIRFMTEPHSCVSVAVYVYVCACVGSVHLCVPPYCRTTLFQLLLGNFSYGSLFKMNGFVHKFSLYA